MLDDKSEEHLVQITEPASQGKHWGGTSLVSQKKKVDHNEPGVLLSDTPSRLIGYGQLGANLQQSGENTNKSTFVVDKDRKSVV